MIVLSFSRIEVSLNKGKKDIQIKKVSEKIESKINNDINSIGIITGKNDNIANLQFQYHLLPNKVDIDINKEFKDHDQLMQYIVKYDYLLLYHPEPKILDWLQPYTGKEKTSEDISFMRVIKDKSKGKLLEKISIERSLP